MKEKQFNRQVALNTRIKEIEKQSEIKSAGL